MHAGGLKVADYTPSVLHRQDSENGLAGKNVLRYKYFVGGSVNLGRCM